MNNLMHRSRALRIVSRICALFVVIVTASFAKAQPTVYSDTHDFGGTLTLANTTTEHDGFSPSGTVVFDKTGNMYGVTSFGGYYGGGSNYASGMVWEITTTGAYVDLHDFGGKITNAGGTTFDDGFNPSGALAFDSFGNLYGTAEGGGEYLGGMVWEITATDGTYVDLHDFGASVTNADSTVGLDGIDPSGGVAIDATGDLYGVTLYGGPYGPDYDNGQGMVWEITSAGVYTDLHDFGNTAKNTTGATGPDGTYPIGTVTLDSTGNLYGTTSGGGPNLQAEGGAGLVWEITVSGTYSDLHDFGGTVVNADKVSGPDGAGPVAGITFDTAGDMFGTAEGGGPNGAAGTDRDGIIWEITKAGTYVDVHDFGGTLTSTGGTKTADGYGPASDIVFDTAGNMYGTTAYGGTTDNSDSLYGAGTVWEIPSGGTYGVLHNFGGTYTNTGGISSPDGANPVGVTLDANGNIYGTTTNGGAYNSTDGGYGILWTFGPGLTGVSVSPTEVTGGTNSTGTVTLSGPAPNGGTVIDLASSDLNATLPATVTVLPGATQATFTVTTTPVSANGAATITATQGATSKTASLEIDAPTGSAAITQGTVVGGQSTTGTISLSGPAPKVGLKVLLSSNSASATVPSSVTVASGSMTASFPIQTAGVSSKVTATITVTIGTTHKTICLIVEPASLDQIYLAPRSVIGGSTTVVNGAVGLNGFAPAAGAKVALTSSNPAIASVPATVTVLSGASVVNFKVAHVAVNTRQVVTITAKYGNVTLTETVTILPE